MKQTEANSIATATHSKTFARRRTFGALVIGMSLFCLSVSSTFAFTLPGLGKLWFMIP